MKQRWFLKGYIFTALGFGVLGLLDSILTYGEIKLPVFSQALMVIAFLFFFFNIAAIVFFKFHEVDRIAFLLPMYHLFTYLALLWVSFGITYFKDIPNDVWLSILIISTAFSVFEIIFCVYLLRRFEFI